MTDAEPGLGARGPAERDDLPRRSDVPLERRVDGRDVDLGPVGEMDGLGFVAAAAIEVHEHVVGDERAQRGEQQGDRAEALVERRVRRGVRGLPEPGA